MPRNTRVAPGGMVFHVLNRGVGRRALFPKRDDYLAFENVLEETLAKQPIRICGYCLMPNHCHVVMRPFSGWELEDILQGMKGTVARRVNLASGGSGSLWHEESFDRIVRDDEHLWRAIQYIGRNPRLAGIPRNAWRRWIHPAWESAGWRFVDDDIK